MNRRYEKLFESFAFGKTIAPKPVHSFRLRVDDFHAGPLRPGGHQDLGRQFQRAMVRWRQLVGRHQTPKWRRITFSSRRHSADDDQ